MMPLDPPPSPAAQPDTLRDLLRATPRVAPERAVQLLTGIARALTSWHARAGAYGALTPDRVLVGTGAGIALAPPPRVAGAPAPWPTYLAPEQIDGRPGDVRSDLYALGLVGWEMLAGQQPWEGESLYGVVVKQREQDLPRLSTLRPGMPRALVVALEGCLHKAPGDRWQTVAEFLMALEPGGAPAPAPGHAPPGFAPDRRTPPAAPAGPVAGAVARAAAAGAVPGATSAPSPLASGGPASRVSVDDEADDERDVTPARAAGAAPRRRARWLAGAVLTLALLGAGAATLVAVQGRADSGATKTWLDSVTAPAGAVGAVPATTTRENTTAAPIRRSAQAAAPSEPEVIDEEAPDQSPEDSVAEDPFEAPALEPTPPLVPRPTVPRPTVPLLPPDSTVAPDLPGLR